MSLGLVTQTQHSDSALGLVTPTQHSDSALGLDRSDVLPLFLSAIEYNFENMSYTATEGSGVPLEVYILRTGADGSTSTSVGMFDCCQDYHFSSSLTQTGLE